MDQLVVASLQESRVDRNHRLAPFAGKSRREGHCVLFGDADIEITIWKFALEANQPRSLAHCWRYADQAFIGRGHVAQPIAEDLRERRLARAAGSDPHARIELAGSVVQDRISFGELDMSLSFRIPSRRMGSMTPALFNPSNAMPALIAPSPITATLWRRVRWLRAATAMPSAAAIDVDECAVPKVSYSLSTRRGNPEMPSSWRKVAIACRRPVRILWA